MISASTESIQNILLYIVFPIIGMLLLTVACFAAFSVRFSSIKERPQIIRFGKNELQVSLVALIFLIGAFFFGIWVYFLIQGYDKKMAEYVIDLRRDKEEIESMRDNKINLTFTMVLDSAGLEGKLPTISDLEGAIKIVNENSLIKLTNITPAPAGNAVRIEVELKRQQLIEYIVLRDEKTNTKWVSNHIWNPFEPNIKLTATK